MSPFKLPDGSPKGLGPSIIDAVYRATGAAGAVNDSLFIIFSENLNSGTVSAADFSFNGGLAAGDVGGLTGGFVVRVDRNLVVMSGFTAPITASGADSVQLSARAVVTGADTSPSDDVSLIQIRTGPAIFYAEIRNGIGGGDLDLLSTRPAGDTLRLYFTHEVVAGTLNGADARVDFDMPEFGDGTANLTSTLRTGAGFNSKVVDIIFTNQDANSALSHGKVLAEVSDVRVRTAALSGDFNATGDTTDDPSTLGPWHLVDATVVPGTNTEMGPYLIAAGYNDKATGTLADDVMTLVFSDDIDPASAQVADFVLSAAPTSPVLSSNDGDHILTLSDFTGGGAGVGSTVTIAGSVQDFQGNFSAPGDAVVAVASPIIVHARFQDGGDADPLTDVLEVFFDEPVIGSFADTTDFWYYGFVSNGLVVTDNVDNDSLLTLTGFTLTNNWERGDRIGLRPGTDITAGGPPQIISGNGQIATNTGLDATRLVRDYSAPRQLHFVLNSTYFRDTQNPGVGPDTAYYAFNEVDFDDADYFLIFTRKGVAVDRIYIETHLNNAEFIANPNPGSLPVPPEANPLLNRNIIGTYDITPGVGMYSDGQVIQLGDNVNFGICAVDADGNIALNTTSCLFVGALTAGPVAQPIDHDCVADGFGGFIALPGTTTDTDMIHIIGDRNPEEHFIFGDPGSVMGADSVRVYDDAGLTILLGSGPANPITGSFALFSIGDPTGDFVWVTAVEVVGPVSTESAATLIRNDLLIHDNLYTGSFRDPINILQKYSPGDTVRVLGAVRDTAGSPDPVVVPGDAYKSDLLAVSANFLGFSTRAGSDSVVFISLGANKNDEDNDWIDDGATSFNGTALAGNAAKDYPEPYVDENGNGIYDCGETFVDYSGAAYETDIRDGGDSGLDSNDPDEHGWYYVEYWIDPNDATLVADPDGGDNFAVLEDVSIPIRILDNAISSQAALDQLSADVDGAPVRSTMTFTTDLSLDHLTASVLDSAFVATLDALAPTVSEISYLETSTSLTDPTSYPAGNLITPGDHVYELPSGLATPYINFVDSTLSDDDVIFVAVQIDTTAGSDDASGWRYLSLDPQGDRGTPAHNDGLPGIPLVDDDYDSTTAKVNGVDDDEDLLIDEDGEGIDNSDAQVTDASQADAAADALADGPDGIHRGNDGIDNDNDAFFRYNAFLGVNIWFNVDESTTNLADDDGDGQVDEADEVENYNAAFDDDEDGMQDGSVAFIAMGGGSMTNVQLTTGGGLASIGVKAFEDPAVLAAYRGSRSTRPVMSGVGMTPGSWLMSYLDKTSDVIGNVSTGFAQRGGKDDFGGVGFSWGARNIVSTGAAGFPVPLRQGPGDNSFDWNFVTQTGRNIDLSQIQRLYDLVDGSEYRMRAVAVDEAYNHNPDWAVPFAFTLDSTAPIVCIPPAQESGTPGTGVDPEFDGFVDVLPDAGHPGLQIYDKGAHPGAYTLRADIIGDGSDIAQVVFQTWDGSAWVNLGIDTSFPYTFNWEAPLLNNAPPANADTVYFRAYAIDQHGNTEAQVLLTDGPTGTNGPTTATCIDDGRVWELQVIVIDGTAPSSCICQVGSDYDLTDGAQVPVEQAVDVSAWFTDNDGDPNTNDVIHVYFEYTPIGLNDWQPFASLTGVPADGFLRDPSGINHPLFPLGPDTLKATVTWDTRDLEAGSYEIRAVAVDIEGNTSVLTACVFTVTLDDSPLRAYIQPVAVGGNTLDTCGVAAVDTLFAQVFIHDRSVASVEFQYYSDDNGNGVADDGNSWISIFTQGDDAGERKGDVTLRAGLARFSNVAGGSRIDPSSIDYRFWDADNNGYSSIDPVIQSADGIYDGGDNVIFPGNGLPNVGTPLSNFAPGEYLVDTGALGTQDDYIMQDNPLNAGDGIDVWMATWDVTGLNGDYLVRAIATDNLGNTDTDLAGSPIPVAEVEVDSDIPSATVTEITLQNGTVIDSLDLNPGQYISAGNAFFYVTATPDSGVTDIAKVLFEWSGNGGASWDTLDVNDDNDFYSDLNGNWQFDEGIDEIFADVDGDGIFSPGDIILSKGDDGILDTPTEGEFATLFPLVSEDPNDGDDNDNDGKTDEDNFDGPSNLGGQSPDDYIAPYTVPFPFHELAFATETNVLFRATAMDSAGNTDCDPEWVSVVVGDNAAPETDVVVAVINGDSLDIETVLRGTLNGLCLDSTTVNSDSTLYLLVTAEDQAEILSIDIYYRVAPSSLPGFDPSNPDLTPWIAAGIPDAIYPYEFNWNIAALDDGTYEFFPRAEDANGNFTMPPTNPYRFSIQRNPATVASALFLGSDLPVSEVAPGDVVVLTASVDDATAEGQVCFYYAERIEGEVVTGISTAFPYISGDLNENMVPATGNGINESVTIGGLPGIYVAPSAFASFVGKTFRHYTVRNSGENLEFGAALPPGTVVTIDYNISSFTQIDCDLDAPYTTEWEIPETDDSETTHFDVMASFTGDATCEEAFLSEGLSIRVIDTEAVDFLVHGIDDIDNDGDISLFDNMPGNALCVSQGLGFDNDSPIGTQTNKLSGDWAEFFVTENAKISPEDSDIDSVWMVVWHTFDGDDADTCAMTENPFVNDPDQVIHKTLFLSDFTTLDTNRVENVTIEVSGYTGAPSTRTFVMYDDGTNGDDLVAGDGHYNVRLELPPGQIYSYAFRIDLVGAEFIETTDPRHNESQIQIPSVPYWWCSTRLDDNSLLNENEINHVHVFAQDFEGNISTNLSEDNQGQIDVILDRTGPIISAVTVNRNQTTLGGEIQIFATVVDPAIPDINVISVTEVEFQVSPDLSRNVWQSLGSDFDPSDGWEVDLAFPFDPLDDNIDNDGDGLFDEADESEFVYYVRAVATDDCFNTTYSDATGIIDSLTVDVTPPVCLIAEPNNGDIFPHGATITISAEGALDSLGNPLDADVTYVMFQYNVGDGWVNIDATPGDDTDGLDGFPGTETPAAPGASVTWNTAFLTETDFYVRLRCIARDVAGNFTGGLDAEGLDQELGSTGEAIEYITIIINDDTAPFAMLTDVVGSGLSFCTKSIVDPSLTLSDQVQLMGIASFGREGDVAAVLMQYSLNGTDWTDLGITNALTPINAFQKRFAITLDTRALPLPPSGGTVWLRVAAMDHDGNLQGDTDGDGILDDGEAVNGVVQVRIDNTEPAMWLVRVGAAGNGTAAVEDGICVQYDLWPQEVARGSIFECADCGDPDSHQLDTDLTFQAADPADGSVDVIDFVFLQFLDDWTNPENPVWLPTFPTIPAIDADGNGIIDQAELEAWLANSDDYCETIEDFQEDNSNWRFSFRDLPGNDTPGGTRDGNWYLQFAGNCEVSGIDNLRQAMLDLAPGIPEKDYRFRALAVDYAGNANTGYQGHILHIDATDPTVEEIFVGNAEMEGGGDGVGTVHVAGGDNVPVAALVSDDCRDEIDGRGDNLNSLGDGPPIDNGESFCESCGIYGVQFQYRAQNGDGTWHILGLGVYDEVTGLWVLEGGWDTPANVPHHPTPPSGSQGSPTTDSLYAIRAVVVDSAGNCGTGIREDAVAVQDVTPPDDTEIVDINGECTYPPVTNDETVNGLLGTTVSGVVELQAATQFGDASMLPNASDVDDVFQPTVFFEARPRGAAAGTPWTMICSSQDPIGGGVIEDAPQGDLSPLGEPVNHEGPIWICDWDTEQLNGDGTRIWPDGQYDVRAWGRDAWGNAELLTEAEAPRIALVTIDNTAPELTVIDPSNPAVTEATIERNDCEGFTFMATTPTNTEDVEVTFWYKLSTDLNVEDSWKMVSPSVNPDVDFNPDTNRPYSYTWDINAISDCGESLVPGHSYDIVASASDLVCNESGPVAAHQAGRFFHLNIVDTIAPRAVITELVRTGGNTDPIKFPEDARVNGIDFLQATILSTDPSNPTCDAPRDVQAVHFWFTPRAAGSTTAPVFSTATWTLADGDVSPVGAETWRLSNWSTEGLAEGSYWFIAIAEDCYGNRDGGAAGNQPTAVTITIDRTCPVIVGVNPSNDEVVVPEITTGTANGPRVIDLIVRNTDNDVEYTSFNDNLIWFQYKPSEAASNDDNWITITSQELRNGGTGTGENQQPTFSAAIDLRNLVNTHNQCANQSGLYDFRVVASDAAGNECATVFATKVVVDNTPPVVEVTHIQFLNRTDDDTLDLTLQPVNGGILPDISAGQTIRVFATVEDDEPCIPPSHETDVFEVQFYLGSGPSGSGTYPQILGTAGFEPTTGQYYINWNTTGLPDGDYTLYAKAQDEVRNFATSQTVTGNVTNPAKPYAQVVAFNPDLLSEITKGTESRIYGLTFGEKLANTMFFQYRIGGGQAEWVNIGSATNTGETLTTRELSLLPQSLWFSNMRISDIPDGTVIDFRAVAVASSSLDSLGFSGNVAVEPAGDLETNYYGRVDTGRGFETLDGDPGDFSGLYDLANTPILTMVKRTGLTGEAFLEYGDTVELITSVTSQGVNFSSNGLVTVTTNNPLVSPFVVLVAEDNRGVIDEAIPEMNRRIDNNLVWTGDILGDIDNFEDIDPTEGARVGLFASAHLKRTSTTGLPPKTDINWKIWHIWQVTPNAGSNGWAGVDGNGTLVPVSAECAADNIPGDSYPSDPFAVILPPGSFDENVGMLLERVARPVMSAQQDLYLTAIGQSYLVRFMDDDWDENNEAATDEGWQGRACIRYDDTNAAIRAEREITVRRWNGSEWTVSGINHIEVDSCANVVCFNFNPEVIGSDNLIFSVVTGDRFSPVQSDVYPYCRGFTDQDPIFKTVLTNIHGGQVNPGDISVFIDGDLVARTSGFDSPGVSTTGAGGVTTQGFGGFNEWVKYVGSWLDVDQVDNNGQIYAVTFGWPCDDDFALSEGQHTFEVTFSDFAQSEIFGIDQPFVFEVDNTPPTIIINGGFVGNPVMNFTPAYIGDDADAITVTLIDEGSGVLFREDRIDDDDYSHYWWWNIEDECAIARYALLYDQWFYENGIPIQFDSDNSFKYDLWRVDGEDDQDTVDEYEERHLLHTGTADELWPNVTQLDSIQVQNTWYFKRAAIGTEGDDANKRFNVNIMNVPLYVLGGGAIEDGDVLEVTLYSKRYETPPINQLNEFLDQISGQGGVYGEDGWWIDFSTKRLIQYATSIQDCVNNAGSRFVEQRFIVDTSAPTIDVTSPGVDCDPSDGISPTTFPSPDGDYNFVAVINETGSGIRDESIEVEIDGPADCGDEETEDTVDIIDLEVDDDQVTFTIPNDELCVGQYRITIRGEDRLGNSFTKVCVLTVGGITNTLTAINAYPNPFDPKDTDVTLAFVNARQSNVKITVYDWNGDKVRTIDAGSLAPGTQSVVWGGDAEDGTPLANGVYLARLEANDGRRTVTETIKIAIWRD